MLVMSALPGAGAAAVRRRKTTAQGARQRLDGTYMMKADGRPLVRREGVTALGKNVDTATAVTASVPTARLAKVVKESHDSDTVGREPARVREHMVINFKGVLREPAELFVVTVAAATEEGRAVEVVDDGVRARTSEGADGVEDPLLGVGNVTHNRYIVRP